MHFEILVEDQSGARLMEALLPKLLGPEGRPHTWRLHPYKGVGRIPKGLGSQADPSKRMLLDNLPRLLAGYGRTHGVDAVLVILDSDQRDCRAFLSELHELAERCRPKPNYMFRLAIEEIEAWYLGDMEAILGAYPRARRDVLALYKQDSVCGTWELLADAIYPGGSDAIIKAGWPVPGQAKYEWAERIGPLLVPDRNSSPSFAKLMLGLQRLSGASSHSEIE